MNQNNQQSSPSTPAAPQEQAPPQQPNPSPQPSPSSPPVSTPQSSPMASPTPQPSPPAPPQFGSIIDKIANRVGILVGVIFGFIETTLGLRLIFKLLAANPSNTFVSTLYQFTNAFVTPFEGIFSIDLSFGTFVLDVPAVIAILIYSLVGYGLFWITRIL